MVRVIAYDIQTLAPHQGMLLKFLEAQYGGCVDLTIRRIGTGKLARIYTLWLALLDAAFRRKSVLYFSSFVSAPFTVFAVLFRHNRWIYHSQDWIQDRPGIASRTELWAVRHATIVIWNEQTRASAAMKHAERKAEILVLPTYLPGDYPVPKASESIRREIAQRAGIDSEKMVAIFAGGSYSRTRLSQHLVEAARSLDENTVVVFTGPSRLPAQEHCTSLLDFGLLAYDDMLSVLASCDIGLLLYDHANSFGNRYQQPGRLTEYLRCGLRLIATPFPDAEKLRLRTDFCMLVRGYDVPELSITLNEMVRTARLDVDGRERISSYSKKNMIYDPAAKIVLGEILRRLRLS